MSRAPCDRGERACNQHPHTRGTSQCTSRCAAAWGCRCAAARGRRSCPIHHRRASRHGEVTLVTTERPQVNERECQRSQHRVSKGPISPLWLTHHVAGARPSRPCRTTSHGWSILGDREPSRNASPSTAARQIRQTPDPPYGGLAAAPNQDRGSDQSSPVAGCNRRSGRPASSRRREAPRRWCTRHVIMFRVLDRQLALASPQRTPAPGRRPPADGARSASRACGRGTPRR
jgi:hypothetical protein